ncbi:Hsp70 family protein [Pseudonocardia bannensis]|uniref:Hsp70 family protein n=1 Tax=Pseudonocardia bannensis TaxID=630973 RepID=A0A848DR98_9PSEU|nr:Hsp70 family protein [Pseudonocardia bannensis]NMH95055.1 Hsp70 family protein [Pseudonocardia bannensis]
MSYSLGVDLGTTFVAAAIARASGVEMFTLGDRTVVTPAVVYLREDSTLVSGDAAARRAVSSPDRVGREFKRRLGDPTPVMLGGSPYAVTALLGALLHDVVARVGETEGAVPDRVVLTHPANWGPFRRELFEEVPQLAGLSAPWMVTEPEAAAAHYAASRQLGDGDVIAVYDLGGGTFDATVLRKHPGGIEILGTPEGIERLGGVDFDEAILSYVNYTAGGALAELDMSDPQTAVALARLRQDCVLAKEALSIDTETTIPVFLPGRHFDVRLARSDFEDMVRAPIESTIGTLSRTLRSAQVAPEQLSAVLLVGGSSRIPLIARMISDALGRPTVVDAHPKYAVALGAAALAGTPATPGAGAPPGGPPRMAPDAVTPETIPAQRDARNGAGAGGTLAAAAVAAPATVEQTAATPPGAAPSTVDPPPTRPPGPGGPPHQAWPPGPGHSPAPPAAGGRGGPPPAAPPPLSDDTGGGRRRVLAVSTAVVVLLALIAGGVYLGVNRFFSDSAPEAPGASAPAAPEPAPQNPAPAQPAAPAASVPIPTIGPTIEVGGTPGFAAVSPTGKQAYVAGRGAGVVTVIDTAVNKVTARIPIPSGPPQYLTFSPDGRRVYVSIWNDARTIADVAVLDTTTNSVIATIPVRTRPFLGAVTPDGKRLYVPNHDSGTVSVIDTGTNAVVGEIKVAPNPHWIEFSRDGTRAYTANHESNVISVLDVASGTVLAQVPVQTSPHSLAVHPTRPLVANVNYDSASVTMIDTNTQKVIATIPVGKNPQEITWAPDGRFAYTANLTDNTVSVINAETFQVTATIPTGAAPTSVAVLPNGQQAYVTNLDAGTLSVLDLAG